MSQILFVFFTLVALSNEALAARYISDISMTVDSREGLYLEPAKTIATNNALNPLAKASLRELREINAQVVELKEEIRRGCYARNVRTGEFIRFSDLSAEEFIIWERMKDPKADIKKYSAEYINARRRQLEVKENLLKENLAQLDAKKLAKFGKGADVHAQELNIRAVQIEAARADQGLEKSVVEKISHDFAVAEEKFLKGHMPVRAGTSAHGGKIAGIAGAAVVGASIVYDVATGEGAQAGELKANDRAGDAEQRSDVGISSLDAQ